MSAAGAGVVIVADPRITNLRAAASELEVLAAELAQRLDASAAATLPPSSSSPSPNSSSGATAALLRAAGQSTSPVTAVSAAPPGVAHLGVSVVNADRALRHVMLLTASAGELARRGVSVAGVAGSALTIFAFAIEALCQIVQGSPRADAAPRAFVASAAALSTTAVLGLSAATLWCALNTAARGDVAREAAVGMRALEWSRRLTDAKGVVGSLRAAAAVPPAVRAIHARLVVANWELLRACVAGAAVAAASGASANQPASVTTNRAQRSVSRAANDDATSAVAKPATPRGLLTAAATHFLAGAAPRALATDAAVDAAVAVAYLELCVALLPHAAALFANGRDVQVRCLFETMPDVLRRRFSVEQAAVVAAHLLDEVFVSSAATFPAASTAATNDPRNVAWTHPSAASLALGELSPAASIAANPLALEAAAAVLAPIQPAAASAAAAPAVGAPATSSTRGALTFRDSPVQCFVAAMVALTAASDAAGDAASSPLVGLALRRLMSDSRDDEALSQGTQAALAPSVAAGRAFARLVLACAVQRLDAQSCIAARNRGQPPWSHRLSLRASSAGDTVADADLHRRLGAWFAAPLLRFPAPLEYQLPPAATSTAPLTRLQQRVSGAFVAAVDVVMAQSPAAADAVVARLLRALSASTPEQLAEANRRDATEAAPRQPLPAAGAVGERGAAPPVATLSVLAVRSVAASGTITGMATAIFAAGASAVSDGASALPAAADGPLSALVDLGGDPAAGSLRRFLALRATRVVAVLRRLSATAFAEMAASDPWGALVPRRIYAETSLAAYDACAVSFAYFASDALTQRNSKASFAAAAAQAVNALVPLAQPFCASALESSATVHATVDRFAHAMASIESRGSNSGGGAGAGGETSQSNTFRFLNAAFTLSGMADVRGLRTLDNAVFAGRWVPMLARACATIEANEATRALLEVHCRSCCSALLRSRRTVLPPSLETPHTSPPPPRAQHEFLSYSGPLTTAGFVRDVGTFLGWVIRPAVVPARAAASRRFAAISFAAGFAACVLSVERLEQDDTGAAAAAAAAAARGAAEGARVPPSPSPSPRVGARLATSAVDAVGAALVRQIRGGPQASGVALANPAERSVFAEGSFAFAKGVAGCAAALDGDVRASVRRALDSILLSPAGALPLPAKRAVIDTAVKAVTNSRSLSVDERAAMALWFAEREPHWMRADPTSAQLVSKL